VRFSILGPLLAEADDGTQLPLSRPSQRATLATLLLHAVRPATKAQLIEALWGDSAPGDADTALRVRMRDLRRAMAGHDRIETHQAGYRIVLQPGELDVENFMAVVGHGRAALDGGDAGNAARLLEQACRLWRAPPLADVPDTPPLRTVTTALLAQWRDAREWLTDARLALGQHHEMLSQIRAVIAADPLPEHPHVQLMLALYRSGQKAGALDAYSRLRELTTREFGQEPGPEAREILAQILDDSPALEFRRRGLVTSGPGPGTVWTPLRQLPAPPPDFTGRVAAIEALARRMPATDLPASGMTVTVLAGPPGIGKTALAVQAAHLASDAFPDGQLYIGFGGRGAPRPPADALAELLRSLGVPPGGVPEALGERAALYRSVLAARRVLVVADDVTAAAQVRPLLPGSPGCAVLVTSGSRLADLEGAQRIEVGPLSQDEAVAFLAKVVGAERVAAEPAAATALAAGCASLPLALRIAGARLAARPARELADVVAALASPGGMLAELAVGDLSVMSRLRQAWQALDHDARHALWLLAHARLAIVPGWLVTAVTASSYAAAHALTDSCLLMPDGASGSYQLAPLIESFALAQPPPRAEREARGPGSRPNGASGGGPLTGWQGFADYGHGAAAASS
jgi:DNA-binding SARP family transcriptional activator